MSIKEAVAVLRSVEPFSILDEKQLKLVAFMSDLVVYRPGEVIIRQGEKGDVVYVLIDGEVDVRVSRKGEADQHRILGHHSFFGEIAVIKRTPRAATVTAKSEATALKVSKDVLDKMIETVPELGRRIVEHIDKSGYVY